ncbi:ankyrin repeat-containing domain protein [Colletotrichum cereale]|nr:ankyrin repeat-containing domain protein [Colletotrichum cereale]
MASDAPVSIASWKFYVHGHYLESDVNGLYKRIMELGDEESHSTVIHDSVIARTKMTVDEALDLEPQSLDAMDNFCLTALQWAVLRNNAHSTRTILSWNPKLELCDYDGRTALHRAAEFGLMDCAGMLLDAGANINSRDARGEIPLYLATTLPDTSMLALLLGKGNAAVIANRYGRTATHGSVFGRFPDDESALRRIVELLQTADASIEARDLDGMSPLVVAVQQSHVAMFRTLRSRGAVIDGLKPCAKQRTVFHIAAMFSTMDMIQTLSDERIAQIDPDVKDETGLTATDYLMGRVTLSQSELSEGQQQAANDEVEPFLALMTETRDEYYDALDL